MPSMNMFAMSVPKDLEADVMRAIGRAQAKIGSLEDARATWQTALDTTTAISSLDAAEERAGIYLEIARGKMRQATRAKLASPCARRSSQRERSRPNPCFL